MSRYQETDWLQNTQTYIRTLALPISEGGTGQTSTADIVNTLKVIQTSDVNVPNNVMGLDVNAKIPIAQMPVVKQPIITSPIAGATDFATNGLLKATPYKNMYGFKRHYRVFEVDTQAGNFSTPIHTKQLNADDYRIDSDLSSSSAYKWRCKDVDVLGNESRWSDVVTFTTSSNPESIPPEEPPPPPPPPEDPDDIPEDEYIPPSNIEFIAAPIIRVPAHNGTLLVFGEDIETEEYEVYNGNGDHVASYWELYNAYGALVHSSGRTTIDLTTYTLPYNSIQNNETYRIRVRFENSNKLFSPWSSTDFKAINDSYDVYLAMASTTNPYLHLYGKDVDVLDYCDNSDLDIQSRVTSVSWTNDGRYLAIGLVDKPYVMIFRRDRTDLTKLDNPDILPTSSVTDIEFSSSKYLVMSLTASPYICIYKRSGDNYTKLSDPITLPASTPWSLAFAPNGLYLSIVFTSTPGIITYSIANDVFTSLANPADLPIGPDKHVSWSAGSLYLAITLAVSPYLYIYKRAGNVLTKLASPTGLTTAISYKSAWSPNSDYLAVPHKTAPYISIYKRSSDSFTKLADPSTLPPGTIRHVAWSIDNTYLAICGDIYPYLFMYKRSADVFNKLADSDTPPKGPGLQLAFTPIVTS